MHIYFEVYQISPGGKREKQPEKSVGMWCTAYGNSPIALKLMSFMFEILMMIRKGGKRRYRDILKMIVEFRSFI